MIFDFMFMTFYFVLIIERTVRMGTVLSPQEERIRKNGGKIVFYFDNEKSRAENI